MTTVARQPRLDLPGTAQRIVQRGNDRQRCFFSTRDYRRYRHDLREIAMAENCATHAVVLMTNHLHLVLTPRKSGSASRLIEQWNAHRVLVTAALNDEDITHIRSRLQRQHTYASGRFRAAIEAQLGRRAGPGKIRTAIEGPKRWESAL